MSTYDGLWPLCETCGAVPTSHKDYRDCEAHMQVVAQAYNGGRENGGKEERAAVVAWLRAEAKTVAASFARRGDDGDLLLDAAEDIECGEHSREENE